MDKLFSFLGTNTRSTLLGIFLIIGAVGNAGAAMLDSDPATTFDFKTTAAAIGVGAGFIWAREQSQHEKDKK